MRIVCKDAIDVRLLEYDLTETLIRKRAEHNNCELSTLEEVSLHQQDVERIEHVDKWCRELRILYLQSNLIPKIENVGRLKKLEYLNLALNNIERIENLEGCESLKKLDLTVNFVGELSSIQNLRDLYNFRELFLVGNPCALYEGYREYVTATLPQLRFLDGKEIEKSERIVAAQTYESVKKSIRVQEEEHRKKREEEKKEANLKKEKEERQKEKKTGFDGRWYTDINTVRGEENIQSKCHGDHEGQTDVPDHKADSEETSTERREREKKEEQKEKDFWEEKTAFTPESRLEVHEHMQEQRCKEEKKDEKAEKRRRKMFSDDDGRPLNVNEAKVNFTLTDDFSNNIVLDLAVFRFLDTSLIDVDVQTNYVRVVIKGKVFQLCLTEEISPDSSTVQRSQTTGHLVITMPKANATVKSKVSNSVIQNRAKEKKHTQIEKKNRQNQSHETLEVDPSSSSCVDIGNIVREKSDSLAAPLGSGKPWSSRVEERANSEHFVDDPDVPPLE